MNKLLRVLLIFLGVYFSTLLLLQVAPVRSSFVSAYNSIQAPVFNLLHPTVAVDFMNYVPTGDINNYHFDYSVSIASASDRNNAVANINQAAGKTAIVPFALLLALIIAGPGTIKRKMLVGLLIVIIILVITAMQYTSLIHTNAPQLSGENGNLWTDISVSLSGLYRTHEATYVIIFSLWAAFCLDRESIKTFIT